MHRLSGVIKKNSRSQIMILDRHQNLMDCSLCHTPPLQKNSFKSITDFWSYPANGKPTNQQTNKPTNQRRWKHNLLPKPSALAEATMYSVIVLALVYTLTILCILGCFLHFSSRKKFHTQLLEQTCGMLWVWSYLCLAAFCNIHADGPVQGPINEIYLDCQRQMDEQAASFHWTDINLLLLSLFGSF